MKVITTRIVEGNRKSRTTTYDEMSKDKFSDILTQQLAKTRRAPRNCHYYFVHILVHNITIVVNAGEIVNVIYND